MMKAMILCAGYGKRLRPITKNCPKPLLEIGQETLLSNTLKFLIKFGIKEVVINTHYLADKIVEYINNNNKFNLSITIIREKKEILDTGGGILNAIKYFSNKPFLTINPDTIWRTEYLKELKIMEKDLISKKKNCSILIVDKKKSFDKNFEGDFNLKDNLVNRDSKKKLKYIYTGLQIIRPNIFLDLDTKIFSINMVWNKLIKNDELYGFKSNLDFFHVNTLETYKKILKQKLII